MSFIVFRGTRSGEIVSVHDTQVAADLAAAADTALSSHSGDVGAAAVGEWWWRSLVQDQGPPTKAKTEALVKSYWRDRADEMIASWPFNGGNKHGISWARWVTTRYWIDSAALCVIAACDTADDNSSWDAADCATAFLAMQALIPPNGVRFWYLNHAQASWEAYYLDTGASDALTKPTSGLQDLETDANGKVSARPAYFRWSRDLALPAYASDAASSTKWDGTGNTINVTVSIGVEPEDD